ncbi:uncharacterized protein TM35_000152720 [Trypanosoma theileri]|uniref:Uncharacterized protein n=1 Tax=Trypanosoma theileri TaxID=67003 RepID=A0A1X0NW49_9TRYP|nr:uncharacterized protein TM35_000152720 [Trypanosoma theileri]ORC88841.1 hypothetical protein TM35_000152720 [Trypanosoma theileri]
MKQNIDEEKEIDTVSHTSSLNDSWRRAAPSSAFPPTLPPKHPASNRTTTTTTTTTTNAIQQTNSHAVPTLIRDGTMTTQTTGIQHPFISAADYSDRKRLLAHITFLSGQLQRAEIMLQGTSSRPVVSETELARFDPVIAQAQIDRLDSALAQIGLLREAEMDQSRALAAEVAELRGERNRLVERVDALETELTALRGEREELTVQLREATEKITYRKRNEEFGYGNGYEGVRVVVAAPRRGTVGVGHAVEELQLQETVQRMQLLLEMFMEPICIAFDAGVVWITETELHRAGVQIDNAVLPEVHNDSNELPRAVESNQQSSQPNMDNTNLSSKEIWREKLETMEEKCRNAEQQVERLKKLLQEEQQRTESMAKEHCEQLEQVHDQVVHERRHIMESLMAEVEEQMRNAFRDGRLYEKKLAEERREKQRQRYTTGQKKTIVTSSRDDTTVSIRQEGRGKSVPCASSTSENYVVTNSSDSSSSGGDGNRRCCSGFIHSGTSMEVDRRIKTSTSKEGRHVR